MNHEYWYLSRAAGFTAYLLLFVAAALGILVSTRLGERVARRNLIFDIHRFTSILALAFSLFHVYILLGDGYFNFNVWQLSLPFISPYRNWQVAAGVFGLYAMAIVVVSFYVRQFVGYRAWRTLHYLTFAMYAAVTLHGIAAGTDTTEVWARGIYLLTGAGILALIFYRLQHLLPQTGWVRTSRIGAALAAAIIAGLLVTRAGLFSTAPSSSATIDAPTSVFLPNFTDADLRGTYTQTDTGAASHLTVDATASGDVPVKLAVDLVSTNSQGRSQVTTNTARLMDPASGATVCSGRLISLNNNVMSITCDGSGAYDGVRITLTGRVNASNDGTFSGSLDGSMSRIS